MTTDHAQMTASDLRAELARTFAQVVAGADTATCVALREDIDLNTHPECGPETFTVWEALAMAAGHDCLTSAQMALLIARVNQVAVDALVAEEEGEQAMWSDSRARWVNMARVLRLLGSCLA